MFLKEKAASRENALLQRPKLKVAFKSWACLRSDEIAVLGISKGLPARNPRLRLPLVTGWAAAASLGRNSNHSPWGSLCRRTIAGWHE